MGTTIHRRVGGWVYQYIDRVSGWVLPYIEGVVGCLKNEMSTTIKGFFDYIHVTCFTE